MEKVFAVLVREDSMFVGVYSSAEKAQEVIDRMKNDYLGKELMIDEVSIDDLSLFDSI